MELYLLRKVMLLSHERGQEVNTDEVLLRAGQLADHLCAKGIPADRLYALELMTQLLDASDGK